jgi:lysophospholipase L1-like esterase
MRWIAILFIGGFLTFTFSVYASEGIISPIPDPTPMVVPETATKPTVTFGDLLSAIPDTGEVIRAIAVATPSPTLAPQEPEATPAAALPTRSTRKRAFTMTLLGDSMMDTLGPVGGGLAGRLNALYPNSTFTVINHGVGAENIDSGLRRLTSAYSYLGLGRNAIVSEKPDIIVVESFGYNPYPLPDINDALTTHWLRLAAIVDTIRKELPETKIVIGATIAPNWDVFGDGAAGLSFSPEGKRTKVEEIKKYIENAVAFAKSQGLPLADAYTPSLDGNGNGKLQYINPGDHIHYSDAGRALFSQAIANTMVANRLLE